MNQYLAVYGLGACWSGYDEGRVISAVDIEDAENKAFSLACDYADRESPRRGGYSYDVELISTSAKDTGVFTRLKLDAKILVNQQPAGQG